MEIEQDVSRTVDSVDSVDDASTYQPRAALGSAWQDVVSTANSEVVHGWLGDGSQATHRARRGDLR